MDRGGIASTATDLAEWALELYGGHLLPEGYLDEMVRSANGDLDSLGFRYGLGVQIADSPLGDMLYHGGGIPGYRSAICYFPEHGIAAAVQINGSESEYLAVAVRLAEILANESPIP